MIQIYNQKDMKNLGNRLNYFNPIRMEIWRKGRLFNTVKGHNDLTVEGINLLWDVMFNDGTQVANASWFLLLVNNSGFSAFDEDDVMNSHTGWTEFTNYSQTTRVAWGSGSAASRAVTNASPMVFNITADGSLKGGALTSIGTKSATTGKLWATAPFDVVTPVLTGDELRITYGLSA